MVGAPRTGAFLLKRHSDLEATKHRRRLHEASGSLAFDPARNVAGPADRHCDVSGEGKLALGEGGVLYGVNTGGGNEGGGTAYSLTPPTTKGGAWTFQVLYSFNGTNNGDWPSPLTAGKNGVLYGTTYAGGSELSLLCLHQLTEPRP
jgi:hypothetical protein